MDDETHIQESFSAGKRWSLRVKLIVDLACVVAVAAMMNYLGARYFSRTHLSQNTRQELSSQTGLVLQALTNNVQITIFYDRDQPLFSEVSELVNEYRLLSPKIRVETIDYRTNPTGAEIIKTRLNLAPGMVNDMIVFESNGQTKIVQASQLSDLDMSGLLSGKSNEIKRVGFKGEMLFTAAIANVSFGATPKAYFLEGHGEHDPERAVLVSGYAKFSELLKLNNVDAARLNLLADKRIPDDCELLIVAGPRNRFEASELALIDSYLSQNGRVMALFKFQTSTGLEPIMRKWGVDIGDNVVFDPNMTRGGADIIATNYASHEIVRPLNRQALHFSLPRSVGRLKSASRAPDAPQVEELVKTSSGGQARGNFSLEAGRIEYKPDAFKDRLDVEIPLAVAVESGKIEGVGGSTRMLVVGDSSIFDNTMIESGVNRDFAVSSVNWLLDRSYLVGGIGPRPVEKHKWNLTDGQLRAANLILLGIIPGSILGLGILVWHRRRR